MGLSRATHSIFSSDPVENRRSLGALPRARSQRTANSLGLSSVAAA